LRMWRFCETACPGNIHCRNGHSQTMVREDLELADSMPSIAKFKKNAKVRINEKKVADNKVVVHGDSGFKAALSLR
jgi:hypothetical protein